MFLCLKHYCVFPLLWGQNRAPYYSLQELKGSGPSHCSVLAPAALSPDHWASVPLSPFLPENEPKKPFLSLVHLGTLCFLRFRNSKLFRMVDALYSFKSQVKPQCGPKESLSLTWLFNVLSTRLAPTLWSPSFLFKKHFFFLPFDPLYLFICICLLPVPSSIWFITLTWPRTGPIS